METLAPATAALVLLIPVTLALAIAKLAGNRDGVTLAEFMAPLATPVGAERERNHIVIPEPEPVAWRFDLAPGGMDEGLFPKSRPPVGAVAGANWAPTPGESGA